MRGYVFVHPCSAHGVPLELYEVTKRGSLSAPTNGPA